jgi:hypothetical protein
MDSASSFRAQACLSTIPTWIAFVKNSVRLGVPRLDGRHHQGFRSSSAKFPFWISTQGHLDPPWQLPQRRISRKSSVSINPVTFSFVRILFTHSWPFPSSSLRARQHLCHRVQSVAGSGFSGIGTPACALCTECINFAHRHSCATFASAQILSGSLSIPPTHSRFRARRNPSEGRIGSRCDFPMRPRR